MTYRRLPLTGLCNARDLGGHPTVNGVTRFGAVLRCEAPRALAKEDIDFLRRYGVTVSIDFRGDKEVRRYPSSLENVSGIEYRRAPTYDAQLAFASGGAAGKFVNWGDKYIALIENARDWVRDTLQTIAGAAGGVICNCTTGKDRTGVISALLLGLCGVPDDDIIADYCVSEIYLKDVYGELLSNEPGKTVDVDPMSPYLRTAPENMAALLGYLYDRGGVETYLKSCGVTPDEIAELRKKLIAPDVNGMIY